MTPRVLVLHVGHSTLTLTTLATVVALFLIAVLVAVVLDARAVPSGQEPTNPKETRS